MSRFWGTVSVVALVVSGLAMGAGAGRADVDPLGGDALMATVRAYTALGPDHLTGTPAEAQTQRWLTGELHAAGVVTGSDAYTYLGFRPTDVALTVNTAAPRPIQHLAPLLYSGVTGPGGVTARMIDVGHGTPAELVANRPAGRIAVVQVTQAMLFATVVGAVQHAGAVGVIAVTSGPGDDPVQQDVDSRPGVGAVPTLIAGRQTGAELIADAQTGVTATLTLTAAVGRSCDTDVWGVLPGADPNRYEVIGTPTSAFDPAASERGAGVAVLVALARTYAAIPEAERPVGLVFAGLSGHEVGYLGLPVLMDAHPNWFSMADAYLHLGASIAALEGVVGPAGTVTTLGVGDPTRALYVSENPALEAAVLPAFAPAQPLAQIPPSVEDPGEQAEAYAAGIPIVAESGSSAAFHTADDQPDGVGPALLTAQAGAWRAVLDAVSTSRPGLIRNANVLAAELATLRPAGTTPAGTAAADPAAAPQRVASCADRTPVDVPAPTVTRGLSVSLNVIPTYASEPAGFGWQGDWQEHEVTWPSTATGAELDGTVLAPNPLPHHPVPGVVIVPGSGPGVQTDYLWAARDLAGHGYVVLTVDPQGVGRSATLGSPACTLGPLAPMQLTPCPGVPWQQDGNYVDAAESGVDFLLSPDNPYAGVLDPSRIGAAGHSLGARAVSDAQGVDHRIGAVVAWDNLASDLNGDAGSASGGPPVGTVIGGELPGPSIPVTPRVPALGEASDGGPNQPEAKKTAFADWMAHGQPAMELVFAGASHLDFAQTRYTTSDTSLQRFAYYTRAWFDLWLRHDPTALGRLTAASVDGTARADFLSPKFRSGLYVPGHVDDEDFRTG